MMMFIAIVATIISIGIITWFVYIWNTFVRLAKEIDKAWANIDVILRQRHDELPKLIEVCKGYMKYERGLLEEITRLRTAWMKAESISEKAKISEGISALLKTLFAVSERYPKLRALETFSHLQERISGLEIELADRREYYNDVVTIFNARQSYIPDLLVAGLMRLQPRELFRVKPEEREEVKIKFE